MFLFSEALLEGQIKERPNRFIIRAELNGQLIDCHCPTTGRIGNLILNDLPCLLSKSPSKKRKTQYTVEAIALNRQEDKERSWIGINQTQINRYLAHYFQANAFPKLLEIKQVKREALCGQSRLDFLLNENLYLEIKMPLNQLNCPIPDFIPHYENIPAWTTDRLSKHLDDLGHIAQKNGRAIMLITFIYNTPVFDYLAQAQKGNVANLLEIVQRNRQLGLEFWQANFQINPFGVKLIDYFQLD